LVFDGSKGDGGRLRLWVVGEKEKWKPGFGVRWVWKGTRGEKSGEVGGVYMEWFDEKGFIVEERLRGWLVKSIPVLRGIGGDAVGEKEAVVESVEGETSAKRSGSGKKWRKKG